MPGGRIPSKAAANNAPPPRLQVTTYSSSTIPCHPASKKEICNRVSDAIPDDDEHLPPGSRAFVECDREVLIDLFHKYAVNCDISGRYLDMDGLREILRAVGENANQETLENLFLTADINGDDEKIELDVRLQQ